MATCCLSSSRRGGPLPPRVTSWPCTRGKAQERLWDQPVLPLPSGKASGVERGRQRPGKGALKLGRWAGPPPSPAGQPEASGTLGEERALLGSDHPTFPRPPRRGCSVRFRPSLRDPSPLINASPLRPPASPTAGAGAASTLGWGGASVRSRGFHLRLWFGVGGGGRTQNGHSGPPSVA